MLNRLETALSNLPGRAAIEPRRAQRFDANHGLFYSPLEYSPRPLERDAVLSQAPDDSWLAAGLGLFVRDEFSRGQSAPLEYRPEVGQRGVDASELYLSFRDRLERNLVYGDGLHRLLDATPNATPVDQVYALLCSEAFGVQANRQHVTQEQFQTKAAGLRSGFRLVLLGLPFRDQNPFRVMDRPDLVTMAEAAFLVRLHCIALAIYQVLPTGSAITVLSDGGLYAPIFGVREADASSYLESIRRVRNRLNIQGTVSVLDLKTLIAKYDGGSGTFETHVDYVADVLRGWRLSPPSPEFISQFESLRVGMRWNYATRDMTSNMTELAGWLADSGDQSEVGGLPSQREIDEIAVRYAATNLVLRWHDVVAKMLPNCVRATMHPKQGQIGIPRFGSCFPWNGVAITDALSSSNVDVHSLSEARRRGFDLVSVTDADGDAIVYQRRKI